MIIANPIYDVVFKKIMLNLRVAKFFISTLLNEEVESIEVKPQEMLYERKDGEKLGWSILRLDYIATIKTETGEYKKILIEIQKAQNLVDVMRFRKYLASQYQTEDIINDEKMVLPITTIYILGFNLPESDKACFCVKKNYIDLLDHEEMTNKIEFAENLTHDCYIIQAGRIKERFQTKLDKLLSVFEQRHFINEQQTIKEYRYQPDLPELIELTNLLYHVGVDPEERKQLDIEQEAWRTMNAYMEEKDKIIKEKQLALEKKEMEIELQKIEIVAKDNALEETNRLLAAIAKELKEKNELIERLLKKAGES